MKTEIIHTSAENQIRFKLKNGDLSLYSFLCGYVQEKSNDKWYKKLYMEHEHFHVVYGQHGKRFIIWDVFDRDELTKARKRFSSIKLPTI